MRVQDFDKESISGSAALIFLSVESPMGEHTKSLKYFRTMIKAHMT